MGETKPLPTAREIKIPTPNDGAFSLMVHDIGCRMYVRYDEGQDPSLKAERTNHTVAVAVCGSYGPLIGIVMRVEGAWFGHPGFAARYRQQEADRFFPDPFDAVKWIKDTRALDPNRTDNGLRDTKEG